jgi:hypothetical protein
VAHNRSDHPETGEVTNKLALENVYCYHVALRGVQRLIIGVLQAICHRAICLSYFNHDLRQHLLGVGILRRYFAHFMHDTISLYRSDENCLISRNDNGDLACGSSVEKGIKKSFVQFTAKQRYKRRHALVSLYSLMRKNDYSPSFLRTPRNKHDNKESCNRPSASRSSLPKFVTTLYISNTGYTRTQQCNHEHPYYCSSPRASALSATQVPSSGPTPIRLRPSIRVQPTHT